MSTGIKIKKEVSCKTLIPIFNAANEKKIDLNKLIEGIPYELSYLLNKHERIEWWVYCKIIAHSRQYFTSKEYEKMGEDFVKNGSYIEGVLAAFFFFSSNKFSRIMVKHFFRMGENNFKCITHHDEVIDKNRITSTSYIRDEYEYCPEFFLTSKGVWDEFGRQIGHKGFKIEVKWIHRGATFDVSWDKEGFLIRRKKRIWWLLNIRKAFFELTDTHEALLNQYNKLEESKILLEKQATQLKTAYEISKSIRQNLDINKTLSAITNALVNEAGFSSACIKLFKDNEGNNFTIEAFSGVEKTFIQHILKPIIINDEKIGELIISPKIESDLSEIDELLNYLLPIINVSIHDSLVLRTVTDYKNNLETKVDQRTLQLTKTQDKLSETIHLLQSAQQVQNRFFTNISHEFRTPLTLILGPVKHIAESVEDEKTRDELRIVHKNANKLLELVNQLLDISKLESGNMKLQAVSQNIIPLIKALVGSFYSYAERKRITLKFNSLEDRIIVYIDKDKIEKIITNILSNAFKFTPEGGQIEVSVNLREVLADKKKSNVISSESSNEKSLLNIGFLPSVEMTATPSDKIQKWDSAEISIRDTGIGIPKEKISKIFDRFYQVDGSHKREQEGTGIGLSLTRELIELHKGKITVESVEGKGTNVTIIIPLGKDHLKPEEIYEQVLSEEETSESTPESIFNEEAETEKLNIDFNEENEKPVLLLVEDNTDVRNYIKDNLEKDYRIMEAADGEDGWNKSIEYMPDLIVSDVMMPKMDGFELCNKLKTDERTSHIPVVLLTAKAANQDKIEGFETGADEYIMKPFELEELKVRINNLIEQRKRLHDHFRKHGIIELDESKITSVDKKFLKNVFIAFMENISNPSFNVESLAEILSISRSVLHKKIVALAGEPPVELIRRIRLTRAAELIEKKFGNISEIALESGFNNPAYFSECFKKQFGVSPSQYLHKL